MEAKKGDKANPSAMLSCLRPQMKADTVVMPISVRMGSDLSNPKTGINESRNAQESESPCSEQHDLYKQHLHDMYVEVIHSRFSH